ncbi:high affinity immunoglobulin gamma Fc receptor I-like [Leuresthes tenuis]|uniref:high affinity immunoglobulin gamma Fc receptor I-like n=1 Tax=Leuresthes tenuis TaxID=355514 RepID=UPI003B50DEF4
MAPHRRTCSSAVHLHLKEKELTSEDNNQTIEQILGLTKDQLQISVHTGANQNCFGCMSHTESHRVSECHSSLVDVERCCRHICYNMVSLQPADTMKTALLVLLLLSSCQTSASHASLTVTPSWSQYFEYEDVSISCEQLGPGEWTVWRSTTKLSQCGVGWGTQTSSTCSVKSLKPDDSGVYWCESKHRDSSNAINITVTERQQHSVILQSPALPVMEGDDVTLSCQIKNGTKTTSSNLPAAFYKDGSSIGTEPTGHMTLHHVTRSDEGLYMCNISIHKKSPPSWLLIRDDSKPPFLTVSPDSSQLFEYDKLSLSCSNNSSSHGWRIQRFLLHNGILSSCGKGLGIQNSAECTIEIAKKQDSGIYWCESPAKQRSNSVNISITDNPVILQSPALPVMEGDDVTLSCRSKTTSSNLPAAFYKDGSSIRTEPTGHMTLHHVTRSDEGLYMCNISIHKKCPPSWLLIRGKDQCWQMKI